jgi:hypothetical protein
MKWNLPPSSTGHCYLSVIVSKTWRSHNDLLPFCRHQAATASFLSEARPDIRDGTSLRVARFLLVLFFLKEKDNKTHILVGIFLSFPIAPVRAGMDAYS